MSSREEERNMYVINIQQISSEITPEIYMSELARALHAHQCEKSDLVL